MNLIAGQSPNLHGLVHVPPNKSHSFRAMIMASLAEGRSQIVGPAVSNDWMLATEALEMLGATITPHANERWEIVGTAGKLSTPRAQRRGDA